MAEKLLIQKKDNITKIFLDDEEIRNVISYELSESADKIPELKLKLGVTGEIEVRL